MLLPWTVPSVNFECPSCPRSRGVTRASDENQYNSSEPLENADIVHMAEFNLHSLAFNTSALCGSRCFVSMLAWGRAHSLRLLNVWPLILKQALREVQSCGVWRDELLQLRGGLLVMTGLGRIAKPTSDTPLQVVTELQTTMGASWDCRHTTGIPPCQA